MANELKPNKGVVVTEINGIKYFKLQSPYPGDYTKNCGLLGNEIDENFFFLRSYDIESVSVENGILTLTRVDGDKLKADVSTKCDFKLNKDTGELIITNEKGEVQIVDGFVVEGGNVIVATNETLDGDGTNYNPLRIAETERTGTYAPANEFIDMAVYDYYVKVSEILEEEEIYFYEEIDKENIPQGVVVVDLPEKPIEVNAYSPEYIRVKQIINLPDATNLGKGYRVVTRETLDNFGLLYDYEGVEKIKETLESHGSLWRVPTREDWAEMLNAAEYCDADRTHDTECVNVLTGKNAGARAKSLKFWKPSRKTESGLPVAGEDNLPKFGTNTFKVYPVGDGDGSRGAHDYDHDIESFGKRGSFWTSTRDGNEECNSNVYSVTFGYDTRKVLQESSKPSSRMSLRLVKDYEAGQMNVLEIEDILGYDVPCVLISNPDTEYSKIWTSVNIGFKDPQFSGMTSRQWSIIPSVERGEEIVYYINEWDGIRWIKKQMNEGDSIVLLDGGLDESGNTIYNHEWRIYSGATEPSLIDTAEAIKEEFQKELDEINERIDDLSAFTETAEDSVNDLANDIIGVEGNVVSGFTKPNFFGAYWEVSSHEEWLAHPDDNAELEGIAPEDLPDAKEWHEEGNANYLELFYENPEHPHEPITSYWKIQTTAHYISDAENIVDAIEILDESLAEAIGDIEIKKLDTPNPDMLSSYVLLVGGEQRGDTIDVPKDDVQIFHEIKLGHSGATIDPVTGVITDGPYLDHEVLLISYLNSEDVYKLVEVDLENIIVENEFASGVTVTDHIVHGVVNPESEEYLSVDADGFKISGVTAIQEELDRTKEGAGLNTDGTYTPDILARYIGDASSLKNADSILDESLSDVEDKLDAEIDRSNRLDKNIAEDVIGVNGISGNTEEGYYIDFAYLEYIQIPEIPASYINMLEVPSHEDIIKWPDEHGGETAPEYIKVDNEFYKVGPTSNYIESAKTVYDAIKALDEKAKETSDGLEEEIARATAAEESISGDVTTLSGEVITLSAATVDEIARLDQKIEDEIARATAAEESISGDVTTLSGQVMSFSAATVDEIARLDGQDIADGDYTLSSAGLLINRKNGVEQIEINFDGNFNSGVPMPTPLD